MTNGLLYKNDWVRVRNGEKLYKCRYCQKQSVLKDGEYKHCILCDRIYKERGGKREMQRLVKKAETPQITALEYAELRDWEQHPEKSDYYSNLIKKRIGHGPKEKKRKEK